MPTSDVTWDGVPLAAAATVREQDGGWFVELEQPLPVGTRLELRGEVTAEVTVAHVQEGGGAGMLVKKAISSQLSAVSSGAEAARVASEEAPEKENGGGGSGGGGKKERRKKKR